jgi:hypothetical protein
MQVADWHKDRMQTLNVEGRPRLSIYVYTSSSANPIEFIALIKYADFMCTSS